MVGRNFVRIEMARLAPPPIRAELDSTKAPVPSDYLGKNLEPDQKTIDALKDKRHRSVAWIRKKFDAFKNFYMAQKNFEHNNTDLYVFFVDYILFAEQDFTIMQYFSFDFWNKPFAVRNTFLSNTHMAKFHFLFNDFNSLMHLCDKAVSNRTYANFIHRDWIDLTKCSTGAFKAFLEKHPRFFLKLKDSFGGTGAKIIEVDQDFDINAFLSSSRRQKMIAEEIIIQHPDIAAFCPDTLNTIRINTILDTHGAVHILTAVGRFGRMGYVVDNYSAGGQSVIIDSKTGIIISDSIDKKHECFKRHPDTGKIFRGFQYPCWSKVRETAIKMAKIVPSLRHVGWDIAVNSQGEPEFVEGNYDPLVDIQQSADSVGRFPLYKPLIDEQQAYNRNFFEILGYRVNNIGNFERSYEMIDGDDRRRDNRIQFALGCLINGCKSVLDVGCRKTKSVKKFLPAGVAYYPVDQKKYDDETIACDFNAGTFPNLIADTCLSIYTAEYVELLPEFLSGLCNSARHQVLMVCRPIDREIHEHYRWEHPFLTDFTEKFLIRSMKERGFFLYRMQSCPQNRAIILYDFRRG